MGTTGKTKALGQRNSDFLIFLSNSLSRQFLIIQCLNSVYVNPSSQRTAEECDHIFFYLECEREKARVPARLLAELSCWAEQCSVVTYYTPRDSCGN